MNSIASRYSTGTYRVPIIIITTLIINSVNKYSCVWIVSDSSAGPRFVVPFGDKLVDYNEHFRLFLSTRNPTPNLPPYASAIVNEVNFTITRAGLTAQVGYGIQCSSVCATDCVSGTLHSPACCLLLPASSLSPARNQRQEVGASGPD